MGKMKQTAPERTEVDIVPPPCVYVMTCDGKPVGVYVDRTTAEYEMHLCKQGDEAEMGIVSDYEIKTMTLITHHIDFYDMPDL